MASFHACHPVELDQTMTGTLYGVGLGPGAPDLMTLRAARLIENAKVIAYPTLAGADSFARSIAAALIAADAQEIVMPGVTSVTACAAEAGRPLVARNERLTVLPGPMDEATLRARIAGAEAVAIMKVGRHLPKIRGVIEDLGLTASASYIERATLPEQVVLPLTEAPETAPYFSMILLTKGADPWL